MYKHFDIRDRVILQHYIDTNPRGSATELAELIDKTVSAIYYELKHNTISFVPTTITFNHSEKGLVCQHIKRFPFCCNGCARTRCSHRCKEYDAYKADKKASALLISSRIDTEHRKNTVAVLDKTVSQLIKDGLSIKVAMMSVNRCDVSESTIRRYVNKGLLRARRIDLPVSVRYRPKKEYKYTHKLIDVNILYTRTYQDYLDYMKLHPKAKVIQIDSVIGKSDDKCALLTIFFMNSKFQLAIKYTRKHSSINSILVYLYETALAQGFKLFDVILTDNGTEFKRLPELEKNENQVVRFHVFYCDPYRSCQKAECERNHGLVRRFFRKGRSLNLVSQEEFDMALSHINSYPRGSLNDRTPFALFTSEYDSIIASIFNIDKIELSQLCLKPRSK